MPQIENNAHCSCLIFRHLPGVVFHVHAGAKVGQLENLTASDGFSFGGFGGDFAVLWHASILLIASEHQRKKQRKLLRQSVKTVERFTLLSAKDGGRISWHASRQFTFFRCGFFRGGFASLWCCPSAFSTSWCRLSHSALQHETLWGGRLLLLPLSNQTCLPVFAASASPIDFLSLSGIYLTRAKWSKPIYKVFQNCFGGIQKPPASDAIDRTNTGGGRCLPKCCVKCCVNR